MKTILHLLPILAFTLLACRKEAPPSSPIPAIESRSLTNTPSTNQFLPPAYSIAFTITYRDGDSDLGLRYSEIGVAPYQPRNPDGTDNRFYYNFFVELYVKKNGNFHLVQPNDPWYSGNFNTFLPYIGNQSSGTLDAGPFKLIIHNSYEGELTWRLILIRFGLEQLGLAPGDVLKLRVQLADRAMHLSNTVDSPEFVLSQ